MTDCTLEAFLAKEVAEQGLPQKLSDLLLSLSEAGKSLSLSVRRGALADLLGVMGSENVQGEVQKKLDLIGNATMIEYCTKSGAVAAIASEEEPTSVPVAADLPIGPYLVCFDPLDGSSNIDINVSIGTIFSVLPSPRGEVRDITDADFLQPGVNQVAAGYIIYGPQTQMVFTIGRGTVLFTLDPVTNTYIRTVTAAKVPASTKEFAINCSNMRHWEAPVMRYVSELLAGTTGCRGKDYNMRWVAAMVTEIHRLLARGGIFMYPKDARDPSRPGKLRLMYEANPMSWLIEQAGGKSTNGMQRIMTIEPEKLHQRVAVFMGSAEEVDLVTSYHKE